MDLVKQARDLLDGVTLGPWEWGQHTTDGIQGVIEPYMCQGEGFVDVSEANARFIAATRDLVPAMADRIEALEAALRPFANIGIGTDPDYLATLPQSEAANIAQQRARISAALEGK